ncbi:GNAT family N-acetyltransferase [Paraburkholderia hayleyella]|uniref:GNAT family N-acetyltransferase n=1 Tax=Paraburkholderia hayleyella TaxID=2152889 RepID=UPI00129123F4|nr:GNAT family N-acetyltransferase [Paraburkholderia hayleyella]
MTTTTRIRLARAADIDYIFEIRTSVKENHLSLAELSERGITHEAIQNAIASDDCIWMAEAEGVPVGFAMADADEGSVFAVFVQPAWEGRGLGRLLMEKAEAFLFERHETIWLETDGRSRASGFCTKLGWNSVRSYDNGDLRFEKRRNGETVPRPKNLIKARPCPASKTEINTG